MQVPCIKHDIYNPAGRYSCMDTTSMLFPELCYSGKGIFVRYVIPTFLVFFIKPAFVSIEFGSSFLHPSRHVQYMYM